MQRQEQLCRDLAAAKGWQVAEVYTDNDISAYGGKRRPAYERMLADLEAGRRDGVLVVDTDRLTRTPAELEGFIDVADRRGVALANVSGDVDLVTSDGRFRARIMGAVARQESEKKSERLRRERAQAAQAGKPHTGPRAFGWEPDGVTPRADEAAVVREACERLLAGESLRSLAYAYGERGVCGVQSGRPLSTEALREILTNPRHAGLRRHQAAGDDEAALYPAVWQPIVARERWEAVVARLTSNGATRPGRPPAQLLSGGLLRCGRCGTAMYASATDRGHRRYACTRRPGWAGCGRLAVTADGVEGTVARQVVARLATPGLAERAGRIAYGSDEVADEAVRELAAAEERMDELAAMFADGTIGRREWQVARDRAEGRIAEARRTLEAHQQHDVLAGLPDSEAALWAAREAGSVEWRRGVVAAVAEAVRVEPAARSGGPFDPERVHISWAI